MTKLFFLAMLSSCLDINPQSSSESILFLQSSEQRLRITPLSTYEQLGLKLAITKSSLSCALSKVFLSKLQRHSQSTRFAKPSRVSPIANIYPTSSKLLNSFQFQQIDLNSSGDKQGQLLESAFSSLVFSQGQLSLLGSLIDPSSFRKMFFGRISPNTLPFCLLALAILKSKYHISCSLKRCFLPFLSWISLARRQGKQGQYICIIVDQHRQCPTVRNTQPC